MSSSSSSALYRQWRSCINRTSLKCPQSSTCSAATYPRATYSSRFLLHNSAALPGSPIFCACRSVCSVVFGRLDPSHVMRSTCHVSFEACAAATPRDIKVSLFSANVSLHVPDFSEEPAKSRNPQISASSVASQNSVESSTATLTDAFSTVAPLWLLERYEYPLVHFKPPESSLSKVNVSDALTEHTDTQSLVSLPPLSMHRSVRSRHNHDPTIITSPLIPPSLLS